jgi:hypothetical protein
MIKTEWEAIKIIEYFIYIGEKQGEFVDDMH